MCTYIKMSLLELYVEVKTAFIQHVQTQEYTCILMIYIVYTCIYVCVSICIDGVCVCVCVCVCVLVLYLYMCMSSYGTHNSSYCIYKLYFCTLQFRCMAIVHLMQLLHACMAVWTLVGKTKLITLLGTTLYY